MKRYRDLVEECRASVGEIYPWDLEKRLAEAPAPLLLDVREPAEFALARVRGSINVPRGVLEAACEWGFEDTVPELVRAREREVIVICRSGYRSLLAGQTLQWLGYTSVRSLKTGLTGWSDAELPMVSDASDDLDPDTTEEVFRTKVRDEQKRPT